MALKTFLLLALAFAAVLLITSEIVAAKEAMSHDNDGKKNVDGVVGSIVGGAGRFIGGIGGRGAGRGGGSVGGRGGRYAGTPGRKRGFGNLPRGNNGGGNECGYNSYCCARQQIYNGNGGYYNEQCIMCCSKFAETTPYKQAQNHN